MLRPALVTQTTQAVSWVYFASDAAGLIKIGFSAYPRQRLGALRGANPRITGFVRVIDGGAPTERWLHKRFAARRVAGEWFKFDREMLTVIPPDEIPVTRSEVVEPVRSLGYQARLREADALGLLKPGNESTALHLVVSTLSDDECVQLLNWMRAQP